MSPHAIKVVRVYPREVGTDVQNVTLLARKDFEVVIETEVGTAVFGSGGEYEIGLIARNLSDDAKVIYSDHMRSFFGGTEWHKLKNTFQFTVPAAAIHGLEDNILETVVYLRTGGLGTASPNVSFCRSPLFIVHT